MITWLLRPWYLLQRITDMLILWPACRKSAPANLSEEDRLDLAKCAFGYHALRDKAWLVLGEDEIIRRISALE